MTPGNQYFQPINVGGIDTFTASGQSGWYQFDVPNALVPVLPGITVPPGATGFVIQANTAIAYCFSPEEADLGTSAWLSLPAGGSVVVSGTQWVRQFCVRLGLVANASFTVQFLTGNIGPILEINAPVTGGITPPPPPGLSAVPTPNVLHVMPAPIGNDATAAPYRLDLPYATPAAAEAAAQFGDTIEIWAGTYVAANLGGVQGVNWMLKGATLEDNGTDPIFLFNGPQCTVGGIGLINTLNAPIAVDMVNAGTLRIQVPIIAFQTAIRNSGGTDITVQTSISGGVALDLLSFGGVTKVYGNIFGNVQTAGALTNCSVVGDITGLVNPDLSSRVSVDGNITGNVLANNNARLSIRGTIRGPVYGLNAAVINIDGAVTGTCSANNSIMNITGQVDGSVTSSSSAQVNMIGSITSSGNALHADGGLITMMGDLSAQLDAILCTSNGVVRFTGTATSSILKAVYCVAGDVQLNGTLISLQDFGAQLLDGILRITGRIKSCRACLAIENSMATYTAILGAGTVLVADPSGLCASIFTVVTLDGQPVTVKSMGVYANLPFDANVTALIQAPVIDVNVE